MKTTALVLLSLVSALALFNNQYTSNKLDIPVESMQAFAIWQADYNKNYNSPNEQAFRAKVFHQNLLEMKKIQETATYTVGLNHLSDLTNEEFTVKYLGEVDEATETSNGPATQPEEFFGDAKIDPIPASVDWRGSKILGGIKNQA